MTLQHDSLSLAQAIMASAVRSGLARSEVPEDRIQALFLVTRAAHLLALHRLPATGAGFPATIQALLSRPDPAIDVARDAFIESREFISFVDLLDLLSAEPLPCASPRLHRGWQDKKQSCRNSRKIAATSVGFVLDGPQRDALLEAWALLSRFFFMPAPLQVSTDQINRAMPPMLELVRRLAPEAIAEEINRVAEEITDP